MKKTTLLNTSLGLNVLLMLMVVTGIVSSLDRGDLSVVPDEPWADKASLRASAPPSVEDPMVRPITPDSPSDRVMEERAEPGRDFQTFLAELEALNLRIVPRSFIDRLEIQALSEDGMVSEAVKELLALGEDEIERLNSAIARTSERLRKLEEANLEVRTTSDGKLRIEIAPLSADFEQIRDELHASIYQELGDMDGSLFWDVLNEKENLKYWSGFGGWGSEISLSIIPDGSGQVGFIMERKHLTRAGRQVGSHKWETAPRIPSDENAEMVESFLGRQSFLTEYFSEHMAILRGSDGFELSTESPTKRGREQRKAAR